MGLYSNVTCGLLCSRVDSLQRHTEEKHTQTGGGSKRKAMNDENPVLKRHITRKDNPEQFYDLRVLSTQPIPKFNTTTTRYKVSFKELEVQDLPQILKTLRLLFGSIINNITEFMQSTDLIRLGYWKGLHSVKQVGDTDEYFSPDTGVNVDVKFQLYKDNGYTYKPAIQCLEWLQFYFKSSVDQLKIPLLCQSIFTEGSFTSTAQKVLTEKVLYGQTISYKNLAALCGNEKACRAVGMAMRNNPISFIVPCHRVITHSGHLGNYSGGHKNKIKQWLLTHENAIP
ncbi:MGMT [Mytilus edulis]|uniref:Methylated-DNA--protein-cysteine methyltransferase n=1 Tax=Mytilus edulis TaxID=6550 RepID=A0A8S3R2J5_MYTED|nr:MGMT [Mytilus edulis]